LLDELKDQKTTNTQQNNELYKMEIQMQDFDMVQEQNEKLKNGLMTAMAEITHFK